MRTGPRAKPKSNRAGISRDDDARASRLPTLPDFGLRKPPAVGVTGRHDRSTGATGVIGVGMIDDQHVEIVAVTPHQSGHDDLAAGVEARPGYGSGIEEQPSLSRLDEDRETVSDIEDEHIGRARRRPVGHAERERRQAEPREPPGKSGRFSRSRRASCAKMQNAAETPGQHVIMNIKRFASLENKNRYRYTYTLYEAIR